MMIIGSVVGMFVNWGIYNLAWNKRRISPWGPLPEEISHRSWSTRLPIVGWLRMKPETRQHGYLFWVRPFWIEVGMALFFGYTYSHFSNVAYLASQADADFSPFLLWRQAIPFLCMTTLLCIATFVDFDERMIPDEVTVFGTLLALVLSAFLPESRLLDTEALLNGELIHLHAYSPKVWFEWGNESRALLYSMGLLGFWGIASMPKLCTLRFGLQRGLQLMLASVIRPRRHSLSSGEKRKRKPFTVTTLIAVSCMLGWVFLYAIWVWGDARQWESLFSSILGMTGGLVLVWGVRIIGSVAAQQEAMGFGDVTLMAMIGAFLGWQAVIITFFIAPFAGIVIGIIQAIVRKENELAFGPYLSLGAIIIVLFWETVWGRIYGVLNEQIDSVPFVLMLLLSAMGGMLFVWRIIKEKILA